MSEFKIGDKVVTRKGFVPVVTGTVGDIFLDGDIIIVEVETDMGPKATVPAVFLRMVESATGDETLPGFDETPMMTPQMVVDELLTPGRDIMKETVMTDIVSAGVGVRMSGRDFLFASKHMGGDVSRSFAEILPTAIDVAFVAAANGFEAIPDRNVERFTFLNGDRITLNGMVGLVWYPTGRWGDFVAVMVERPTTQWSDTVSVRLSRSTAFCGVRLR